MNGTNVTKRSEALPFEHSSTVDGMAYTILMISVVAVLVNLPVVLAMLRSWKNLLFSDILLLQIFTSNMLLGIGYTLPIYGYFVNKPVMSIKASCNFTGYYVFVTALLNIGALQILSFHQYVIIKRPLLGYRLKNRRDYGIYASLISAVVALIVPLPPLLGWSSYVFILKGFTCELDFYSDTLSNKFYCVLAAIFAYFIPLFNMIYCGSHCIFSRFARGGSMRKHCKKRAMNKKERRLTTSIFAMFLGFMITWSPYAVICALTITNGNVTDALHIVCIMFAKFSTIICSLIYFLAYRGNEHLKYTCIVYLSNRLCGKCRRKKDALMVVIGESPKHARIPLEANL